MTKQSQIRRNNLPDNKLHDKFDCFFRFFNYILWCLAIYTAKYIGKKAAALALPFDFLGFWGSPAVLIFQVGYLKFVGIR